MPDHTGGVTEERVRELARDEAEDIAERAAAKAVKATMALLRIKVDNEESVDAFIDGQKFVRDLRSTADFADNMRYVTSIRTGTGKITAAATTSLLDAVKGAAKWLLIAAAMGVSASLGIHYPITAPPAPTIVGGPRQ